MQEIEWDYPNWDDVEKYMTNITQKIDIQS